MCIEDVTIFTTSYTKQFSLTSCVTVKTQNMFELCLAFCDEAAGDLTSTHRLLVHHDEDVVSSAWKVSSLILGSVNNILSYRTQHHTSHSHHSSKMPQTLISLAGDMRVLAVSYRKSWPQLQSS